MSDGYGDVEWVCGVDVDADGVHHVTRHLEEGDRSRVVQGDRCRVVQGDRSRVNGGDAGLR